MKPITETATLAGQSPGAFPVAGGGKSFEFCSLPLSQHPEHPSIASKGEFARTSSLLQHKALHWLRGDTDEVPA